MEKLNIIYFGNDWFGENKTSSHHIAQRLADRHRVLYIECPGLRMPKRNKRDIKKIFSKVLKSLSDPIKAGQQFWVYTLFQIPLHRFTIVRRLNQLIILFSIKRVARKLSFSDPLLWFLLPHLSMIPGNITAKGVIYYCIDNYAALPDVDVAAVEAMDEEITRRADLVFAASVPIYSQKTRSARNLILSPHGVDFDHFNQAAVSSLPVPSDIASISAPIIGFWGLIEKWIDLKLIAYLAQKQPSWQIVMIGRVAVDENPCTDLPNVHFLGAKKFAELPSYAATFRVGILPYLLNEQVYNSNPIKLREYLAAGKPVVSVRCPEVEKYADVVSIADSYEQFEKQVNWYLANDTADEAARRVQRVSAESWDSRVEEILSAVDSKLIFRG